MTAMSPSFQSVGMFPSSNHMVFISWWSMVVEVSRSACRASDGMSSGPAALPRQSVHTVRPKHLTGPHRTGPHRTAPHLTSPHLTSPHLTSPHLTSPHRLALPSCLFIVPLPSLSP